MRDRCEATTTRATRCALTPPPGFRFCTWHQRRGVGEAEVPWLVLSGVGHALQGVVHGWFHTACGTLTPNGRRVAWSSIRRRCAKCVKALNSGVRLAGTVEPAGGTDV